ncbi:cell division protein FtsZ [Shumkonia mesophila]|uniref:cell division protein FtsZ n=1 Tax=Shumkonia mesophila TaxID=2838854 RepID=UPI00293425E5|nr:cell division protein FtsZ [Shumkonia mesophila]
MSINLSLPTTSEVPELRPRITVFGVGGAGCNAVNNMIQAELEGVNFVVANTDAQALAQARTDTRIQLGATVTQGLGAGNRPEVGRAAAEETMDEIVHHLEGSNMVFITAGMGGGTGTGAAPVVARAAREMGILTIGVVTKPFHFEGMHRMRIAEAGINDMEQYVDTLIIIPNQNLFRVANEKTTFADAFKMADDVLYSGVRGVTDLMVMPGLINLDFADIRSVMSEMGKAMMGTGEAEGERRALEAAEAAIANPLLDDTSMKGAKGVLINITGGTDMTLFEVDEAANRIRAEVDGDAFIIFGSTFDASLDGKMRISVVATGMSTQSQTQPAPVTLDVLAKARAERAIERKKAVPAEAYASPLGSVVSMPATQQVVAETEETAAVKPEEVAAEQAVAEVEPGALDHFVAAPSDQVPAPAAAPSVNARETFIPARPVGRNDQPMPPRRADPFAGAAMANGARAVERPHVEAAKPRGPSLFEKVTGTGRAAKPRAEPAPVPMPATKEQSEIGGLDPSDRLQDSQSGDDLLDIPAFLRRQAN